MQVFRTEIISRRLNKSATLPLMSAALTTVAGIMAAAAACTHPKVMRPSYTLHPALICFVDGWFKGQTPALCSSPWRGWLSLLVCLPATATCAQSSYYSVERGCFVMVSWAGIEQCFTSVLQEVEHLMSLPAQIHAMVQQGVPWWQIVYTGIMSTDAVLMIEVRMLASFVPHLFSAPCQCS